jgi:hypothetical protein
MPFQLTLLLGGMLKPTRISRVGYLPYPQTLLGWKGLPGSNTIAYYEHLLITDINSFITLCPGPIVIKLLRR